MNFTTRIISTVCFFFLLSSLPVFAQVNPFLPSGKDTKTENQSGEKEDETAKSSTLPNAALESGNKQDNGKYTYSSETKNKNGKNTVFRIPFISGMFQSFNTTIADMQKTLNKKLSAIARSLKGENTGYGILLILSISFAYGLLHALGPGHRKTILFSYFLTRNPKPVEGIAAGTILAVTHAISAVVLVYSLYFLVQSAFLVTLEKTRHIISLSSYSILVAIGIVMFILSIRGLYKHRKKPHTSSHFTTDKKSFRKMLPILISAGAVPCPGVSAVIIFTISLGMSWLGVAAAAAMSLGMAVTIALSGILAILVKKGVLLLPDKKNAKRLPLHSLVELTGSILIICFAGLLLLANL